MKYMKINGRTTTPSIRSEKISFRNSFLSVKIRDCLCLVREDARQRFQRLFLRIKFYADTFLRQPHTLSMNSAAKIMKTF